MALIIAVFLPLLAALLCWLKPLRRFAWGTTVLCLSISFALAVIISGQVLMQRASNWRSLAGWKWTA